MKKFKKFILCTSIAILSIAAVGCTKTDAKQPAANEKTEKEATTSKETSGKDVAKVGDVTITEDQVTKEMAYIEQLLVMQYGEKYKENEEAMKAYNEQKKQVVDYLVNIELVKKEAAAQKIEVKDTAVEEKIKLMKANFPSEEAFNDALKQQNKTLDQFKEDIKQSLMVEQIVATATKDVKVEDKEVEAYYKENIATFTVNPGANISHILVKTEEEAKKVKAEYDGGKSFEELAAAYGTDGTKDQGGSLGFIPYDSQQYDKDFLEGAKKLKEGEVSAPVKTQFGWHLIKVDGITKEAKVTPLAEASEQIKQTLLESKKSEAFNAYLGKLKEKTKVKIFEEK